MSARASARRGLAHSDGDGARGIWLPLVILAILLDLGTTGRSAANARRRRVHP